MGMMVVFTVVMVSHNGGPDGNVDDAGDVGGGGDGDSNASCGGGHDGGSINGHSGGGGRGKDEYKGFPGDAESTCQSMRHRRDVGSIPGSGRSAGIGNGNPLQYSCWENLMDRGAWPMTVHGLQRVGHNQAHMHQHQGWIWSELWCIWICGSSGAIEDSDAGKD